MRGMAFQKNPSNGSRKTADQLPRSLSKVPLIIDRWEQNVQCV